MCIFCDIASKKVPTVVVYEDADIFAFKDLHPVAPIHVLIIPKIHIESVNHLEEANKQLVGKMVLVAKQIAEDLNISENGYKLLIRTGKDGGQEVPHLHLHLIGGGKMHEDIRAI